MASLIAFVFFTALVGFLTWLITRRDDHQSSTGYFLAGRTLTGGYIAGSLLLTNLSTEQLVGLNGDAFSYGLCVMAWEVVAALSLVILALICLPRYLKSGIATIPQFLENRFDRGTRDLTTLIFLIAYLGITLPTILYTGAKGLSEILDIGTLLHIQDPTVLLWISVWMIGIIGSIYAIFGGLRTVAVSDTLNGFGLLTGGLLITYFGLLAVNNAGLLPAMETLQTAHPEKFNSIGSGSTNVPFSTLFTGVLLLNLFYWTTNQQIIQRTFGARNLAEAQKGVLMAGVFKMFAPLILVLPGIIAFHLYPTIDSVNAYATLVRNVLPTALTGFFAAVVFGAILSSFNSVLNSSCTIYSLGVYKGILKPTADEHQVVQSGKWFGWAVAILAMCVAPLLDGQESIFGYLQKMNALYFIPIFAVMFVGLTTRRVPGLAAKIALVTGCLVIAAKYVVDIIVEAKNKNLTDQGLKPITDGVMASITGWENLHFIGVVFVCLVVMMLLVGMLRPRTTEWTQEYTGEVDLTPWKWSWPASIGLVAFVLCVYGYFADFSVLGKETPVAAPAAQAPGDQLPPETGEEL